ncbi:Rha family transcriptional regulator, partial [Vibrio parahaemolyticus]
MRDSVRPNYGGLDEGASARRFLCSGSLNLVQFTTSRLRPLGGDLNVITKEATMPAQTTLPIEQHRPEDLVFISQTNKLVTDSFLVAKYFGKRHDDVLRKIRNLNCSYTFTNRNFTVCHKNNELQNNKLQPFYQMT